VAVDAKQSIQAFFLQVDDLFSLSGLPYPSGTSPVRGVFLWLDGSHTKTNKPCCTTHESGFSKEWLTGSAIVRCCGNDKAIPSFNGGLTLQSYALSGDLSGQRDLSDYYLVSKDGSQMEASGIRIIKIP